MISVNDFKEFIETISNKDSNGAQSPAQFNYTLAVVVGQYIDKLKLKIREFQLVPNKNYALIAKYERYLLEIISKANLVVNPYGYAPMPSDWAETKGLNYNFITGSIPPTQVPYQIREATNTDFAAYESSQLNQPTKKGAVATYYPGQLKVLPKNIGLVEIIYYINYTTPFWAYTMVNNQETYTSGVGDNGATVQIPLPDLCMEELASNFCKYLGVEIKEEWLEKFSREEEAKNE